MSDRDFHTNAFTPTETTTRRLTAALLEHADPQRPLRILDVGCGTGDQLFRLAAALPLADLTGVDVSRPSIEAAQAALRQTPYADRLRFHAVDYLDFHAAPFDLIYSWSVVHCIPVADTVLFGKIAADLAPGGLFLQTLPCQCPYNRLLYGVRAVFRACRGPLLDRLVLRLGQLLAGRVDGRGAPAAARAVHVPAAPAHLRPRPARVPHEHPGF
jgi:trans-aconitate methyltransferase